MRLRALVWGHRQGEVAAGGAGAEQAARGAWLRLRIRLLQQRERLGTLLALHNGWAAQALMAPSAQLLDLGFQVQDIGYVLMLLYDATKCAASHRRFLAGYNTHGASASLHYATLGADMEAGWGMV